MSRGVSRGGFPIVVIRWLRVALAVAGTACNSLLGDVAVEDDPLAARAEPGVGIATGSGTLQPGSLVPVSPDEDGVGPDGLEFLQCEVGTVLCVGSALQLCVAGGRWLTSDVCGSPSLCKTEPPGCQAPACALDQLSCDGAVLSACNVTRDGWVTLDSCASAAHCSPNARQCMAAPCAAGELTCNALELQRCADDQLGWVALESCETAALCERTLADGASGCAAPVCEAGARRCVEERLERCNEGRTAFELVEPCTNAALCELSLERGSAVCESPSCAPGEQLCRAETLTVCNEDRTGFDDVETCGSAVLCDPDSPSCRPPACEVGARRCNGAQIETCNLDRTAFVVAGDAPCASASLCVESPGGAAACAPPACQPNELRCQGARLETCNAARTGFTLLEACASEALCVEVRGPSFDCAAPTCSAGESECRGRNLRVCTADLTAFSSENCGLLGCNADVAPARCRTLGDLLP